MGVVCRRAGFVGSARLQLDPFHLMKCCHANDYSVNMSGGASRREKKEQLQVKDNKLQVITYHLCAEKHSGLVCCVFICRDERMFFFPPPKKEECVFLQWHALPHQQIQDLLGKNGDELQS